MSQRSWNGVRFDPHATRGHSESYFLKLNDAAGRRALWLKITILEKVDAEAVAEVWAVAFDRQGESVGVKNVVPFGGARFSSDTLDIVCAGVTLRDGRAEGSIEMDGHRIEWGLTFTTNAAPLVHYPRLGMYSDRAPYWKAVSPHPDSVFTGRYAVDGVEVVVEGWRGMQGHNWGKRHTHFYAWGHCSQWTDAEDLVFEGFSGRPKIGPVVVPTLSMFFVCHRGVRYAFNELRALLRNRGEVTTRSWRFSAVTELARVEGDVSAKAEQLAGLRYESPDGGVTYCLNSKIADLRLSLEVKGRAPLVANSRAAAFEVGTPDADHGVRMLA